MVGWVAAAESLRAIINIPFSKALAPELETSVYDIFVPVLPSFFFKLNLIGTLHGSYDEPTALEAPDDV